MSRFFISWFGAAFIFVVLDALWLSLVGARLYRPLIGELLAPRVNMSPAVLFYCLYITALVILAITPAIERGGIWRAIAFGAVLGLAAYGTYDLTNHAVMKVWDIRITIADMAWGAFVSAAAAGGAYAITVRFS